MYKMVALFFEEVWLHRRNRFIAVGGAAAFSFFLTFALFQVSWVPEPVKTTGTVISMGLVFITMLMMVFYTFNFLWLGLLWSYTKIAKPSRSHQTNSFDNRG
jgi:hypothetical protein